MTSIKNEKTALVAIVAIAANTIDIGNGRMTIAAEITTVTKNTGVNVLTDIHQKQDCQTVGGMSGIANLYSNVH